GDPVMAGTARDDRPDVHHNIPVDHVACVVPVHRARRVPGYERHRITDPRGEPPAASKMPCSSSNRSTLWSCPGEGGCRHATIRNLRKGPSMDPLAYGGWACRGAPQR